MSAVKKITKIKVTDSRIKSKSPKTKKTKAAKATSINRKSNVALNKNIAAVAKKAVSTKKVAKAAVAKKTVPAKKKAVKAPILSTAKKTAKKVAAKKSVATEKIKQNIVLAHHEDVDQDELVNVNIKSKVEQPEKVLEKPAEIKKKESVIVTREIEAEQQPPEEYLLLDKGERVKDVVTSSLRADDSRQEEKALGGQVKARRSIKLYRKIAFSFIFFTLILLAAIFYFSLVKATIILVPNQERISNNMIIDIYDIEMAGKISGNAIRGVVKSVAIEHEGVYEASGTEVIGEEVAGMAKIINNYNKNQPLVATTRLLTPDGKLYRIKETVNVPAGGSVEVEIYADKPGVDMAIGPTKFTVPGLWAGLQDKIYAESSENIVYKQKVKKHITQEDIDNAIRDLKKELLIKAKEEINEIYKDYSQIIYKTDENSIESEVLGAIKEEKDDFGATMKAEVTVVAFDDKLSANLAKQKFMSSLSANKEVVSFDEKNIIYSLNNYSQEEGVATVNATFEGKVSLKENSNIVKVDKILGLNEEQLNVYLSSLPEIAGFEVQFSPSFIKKVPKLVDRIEIIIKK